MDDQPPPQATIMSEPPGKFVDAFPVSPSHTDESGYYSPRGSSSCPPNTRFFPCTNDADFGLDMSDEEDDVFADPDFAHMTPMVNEERSYSQPEVDMDLQLTVAVPSRSALQLNRPRSLSFPFDSHASTGPSPMMRHHLLRRPSSFWQSFRPQAEHQFLKESDSLEEISPYSDDIDGEVSTFGSPPQKAVDVFQLPEDEPYSDDGASSTTSHSPHMFRDDEASWDLPDIITSGTPRRRTRTRSEVDATRMKKLEYRIACRLAQIGDEFDHQMFRSTDAVDGGGRGLLAWIGSGSSTMVTQIWHYITRQGGSPPFGLSRQRSHSTAD